MIIDLHTWHGTDFDLSMHRVDHSLSPYEGAVPHLHDAYRAITKRIGTDQFLFGYLSRADAHLYYERGKEVYYHLKVPCIHVPLFIRSAPWEKAIWTGGDPSLAFSEQCTPDTRTAVFLCPVSQEHIFRKQTYRIHSCEKAELIE